MNYSSPALPPPYGASALPVEPPPFEWIALILGFIRRRWWLVALCTCLAASAGVFQAVTGPIGYTAVATLVIEPRRSHPFRAQAAIGDAATDNVFVETQARVLDSSAVMLRTVRALNLLENEVFKAATSGGASLGGQVKGWLSSLLRIGRAAPTEEPSRATLEQNAAETLAGLVSIQRSNGTTMLSVWVRTGSPELSALIANTVAESFIAIQLEAIGENTRLATAWLQGRIQDLQATALEADRAVQDYRARNNIISTDRGLISEQQLAELSTQLTTMRARTGDAQARSERISNLSIEGLQEGSLTEALQSLLISNLRQQFLELARREAEWSQRFGPNHSALLPLQREMAELRRSITSEIARIADTSRADLEAARAAEAATAAQLAALTATLEATNNDRIQLRSLESAATTYRLIYESFLQRYTQAVADQSYPIPDARLVDPALTPLNRSHPRRTVTVAAATVVGVMFGFALAFLMEAFDRKLRTPRQLRAATGLDCLAIVPRLPLRLRRRGAAAIKAPPAGFPPQAQESLRSLEARLLGRAMKGGGTVRVMGCIGTTPGAGVSTIAAFLARSAAEAGRRALLIDLDYRTGGLSHALSDDRSPGFAEVVSGEATMAEAVITLPDAAGLRFLPRGRLGHTHPSALLGGEGVRKAIAAFRESHDVLILDLPAISRFSDATAVLPCLDGCLLIAEWGGMSAEGVAELLHRFDTDGTLTLGTVMTKVDLARASTYGTAADRLVLRTI